MTEPSGRLARDATRTDTPGDGVELSLPRLFREPNLTEKVQEILLQQIVEQQLPPGHVLPPERVLAASLGVSRSTVREAIRALIARRVLQSRTGSGVWVAPPDSESLSESMTLYLRANSEVGNDELHEVRATLVVPIASLAATRATQIDIENLQRQCDQLETAEDPEAASLHDVEFHRALAIATGNKLYVVLLDALAPALYEMRLASLRIPGRTQVAASAHRAILEAVIAGDSNSAADVMRTHLEDSNQDWRSRDPAALEAESM